MFEKLETFYLTFLRVVILIAATIALLIAVFATVSSAPSLLDQLGVNGRLNGGDLAQFIDEQSQTETSKLEYESVGTEGTRTWAITPSLQASSKRLTAYVVKHHDNEATITEIEKFLVERQSEFSLEYHSDYEMSLENLTGQLEASTGEPLSPQKLDELLYWHDHNFELAIAKNESGKEEKLVSTLTKFAAAGGAFLAFVFLVFCFLFVKIERNLRVVRVANAGIEEE